MGSVAERHCANGEGCVEHPTLGEPAKLSTYNPAEICNKCQDAARDAPPEHEELFRAARALFDNDVRDEDEIIPTLVFAGNRDGTPRLKSTWDGFAKAQRGSEAWAELEYQLYTLFGGLVLPSRVVDGVPVVRRAPFRISVAKDKDGHIEEIAFDVFKRSVMGGEVGKWYKWYLDLENLDYDLNDLSRGVVAYKTDNREFFRLIAWPEERSVDAHGILPITQGVSKFPHPEAVAGMYEGLRKLIRFSELPSILRGRLRGDSFKPHNLVPACVAWYLSERERLLEERGTISQVTKILDDHLLLPCGKEPAHSIRKNLLKVKSDILYFEHSIQGDD